MDVAALREYVNLIVPWRWPLTALLLGLAAWFVWRGREHPDPD
jgi:hypothetical protein